MGSDISVVRPTSDPARSGSTPQAMRVAVIATSLRRDSLNRRLARLVARCAEARGAIVELRALSEFDMPLYDEDAQDATGFPPGAQGFRSLIERNDAFLLASPEYNASFPGSLKNAIDWVSRFRPQPFNQRHCLLVSASPAMTGGNRGLWALRIPLEHLGARVYPDMFSLAEAHIALDDDGGLLDMELHTRLDETVVGFLDLVEAATQYGTAKRAWIEFLGQRTDSAVDRVDEP